MAEKLMGHDYGQMVCREQHFNFLTRDRQGQIRRCVGVDLQKRGQHRALYELCPRPRARRSRATEKLAGGAERVTRNGGRKWTGGKGVEKNYP